VETRASLFPVKVLRKSAATYEVMIEEPLELGAISTVQKAAEKIYAALERDIQLNPTQWDYWERLHEITEPPHQESKEIAGTV
jgi:lauroyl/myristoyl acyltransferase